MNSLFNNIVELIDSEAIYRELDGVNHSLKNTFADKIEKYRSMIEREIISIKTEMSNIYKRLTVEELAHNMKKSELLQSTASHDILLQKIAVLEDESSKVPSVDQWKKVKIDLLALKEKYKNVLMTVATLEEEKSKLLREKKNQWSYNKAAELCVVKKEKEQCYNGWNIKPTNEPKSQQEKDYLVSTALAILQEEIPVVKENSESLDVESISSLLTDFGRSLYDMQDEESTIVIHSMENVTELKNKLPRNPVEKILDIDRSRTNSEIYTALVEEVSELLSKTSCNEGRSIQQTQHNASNLDA